MPVESFRISALVSGVQLLLQKAFDFMLIHFSLSQKSLVLPFVSDNFNCVPKIQNRREDIKTKRF